MHLLCVTITMKQTLFQNYLQYVPFSYKNSDSQSKYLTSLKQALCKLVDGNETLSSNIFNFNISITNMYLQTWDKSKRNNIKLKKNIIESISGKMYLRSLPCAC